MNLKNRNKLPALYLLNIALNEQGKKVFQPSLILNFRIIIETTKY